ncbi:MAG: TIGR04086 family membrane protein [Acetatifactor sp.]
MRQEATWKELPILFLMKTLLFSYLLTGAFLALLSFMLYKFGLGERTVTAAIIIIYVAATFFAGFLAGKKMGCRKFIWGALEGGAYFLVLVLISLVAGQEGFASGNSFFTTLILCAGGGMLGGMLS